jgi:hypothetical protein
MQPPCGGSQPGAWQDPLSWAHAYGWKTAKKPRPFRISFHAGLGRRHESKSAAIDLVSCKNHQPKHLKKSDSMLQALKKRKALVQDERPLRKKRHATGRRFA